MVVSSGALLGAAGISALGSLATGFASAGFGAASSKRSYHWQRDLMNLQAELNYKYGKKSALNQYSWQRKGLEKAGYNPLLALGGAEGVANTGWTSSQSAPDGGYGDAVNSALAFAENMRQWKLANSQKDVNDATIKNTKTDTQIKENQRDMSSLDLLYKDYESNYYEEMSKINFDNFVIDNKIKNEELTQMIIKSDFLPSKSKAEILNMISGAEYNSAKALKTIQDYNIDRNEELYSGTSMGQYLDAVKYGRERIFGSGFNPKDAGYKKHGARHGTGTY